MAASAKHGRHERGTYFSTIVLATFSPRKFRLGMFGILVSVSKGVIFLIILDNIEFLLRCFTAFLLPPPAWRDVRTAPVDDIGE